MSENKKDKSKEKLYKKLNSFDYNNNKLFSNKYKMIIKLSSSENNDINLLEKKFFSDKMLNNEKKINQLLLETESEKIKNDNLEENINDNINTEKENDNKEKDKEINDIEKEKENKEKKSNDEIEINKEKEGNEEEEINEEKKMKEEKENEKEMVNDVNNLNNNLNEVNQHTDNEKEILNENDIMLNIEKNNLELMQEQTFELQNQYKDLLNRFKKEENEMNKSKNECNKRITRLNINIRNQAEINKKTLNNISEVQNELNNAYDKLVKYFSKNKNNFYNHVSSQIEKQLKIKESQYNYNQKVTLLLMKEINKYNRKIKFNTNIDENIKQENPLINKKEEEYRFILNKLNEEIDILKQDVQALKLVRNRHKMCSKLENKLINEIEFYKVEKQKKLDYIVSLNKFKYFQKLRKRKVLIEKEQFKNLSTNNLQLNPMLENSLIKNELESKKEIEPVVPMKKILKLKRLNHPLSVSKSSKNIKENNKYEKAKKYELDKKIAEKSNEKKLIVKEKFNENSFSNFRLIPNKLFTDEEKSIFKNYQFIPDEEVDNCEKKYTNRLEQISKTERAIKKLGKKNAEKIINIKFKIINNDKKQKNLEKLCLTSSLLIKQNAKKILKLKELIKEKQQEEKKIDMELRKENMKHEKLKEILQVSNNIGNPTTKEESKEPQNDVNNKDIKDKINNEQDINVNQTNNEEKKLDEENNNDFKDNKDDNKDNKDNINSNLSEKQLIKENENNNKEQ